MKRKICLPNGYVFYILLFNGFFTLALCATILESMIFTSTLLALLDLLFFAWFMEKLLFEKIIIEEDWITIYTTGYYPDCKGIKKIRKKVCFQFKDILLFNSMTTKWPLLPRFLEIRLSTGKSYTFKVNGFQPQVIYKVTDKYFQEYKKNKKNDK